jgi:cytochrome d ubiquinol oxidase subunit II
VPIGNASGHLFSSWINPFSFLIGALAVAAGAYLAAVYLAADATRIRDDSLQTAFQRRALVMGAAAGVLAIAGLIVLRSDTPQLYHGLVHGGGLVTLIVSIAAGLITLVLVWDRRYALCRYTAALAVAAIIAGWTIAQAPHILPGLTLAAAAAPHDTLVLVVVVVLAGAAILFPSLVLLFRLVLSGRFDPGESMPFAERPPYRAGAIATASRPGLLGRCAAACALVGVGLLTVADASWAHAIGVVNLLAFIVLGFAATEPTQIAGPTPEDVREITD